MNFDSGGMTKERYLTLCEQMGTQPDEKKCPPDFSDFPDSVQQAILVFNRLGDRTYPDVGYLGKDYTSLDLHMRVNHIENEDLFLETLVRLDSYLIKRSGEQLKKARDAAKKR